MAKKAKTAAKTAKKTTAKKSTAKKSAARKSTAKKSAARKSTAKKSAAKKSAAKKAAAKTSTSSTKTTAKLDVYSLAKDAPGERYFVLANGKPVKHVAELAEVLGDIEDHVFNHHVNPERNDFHNWVREVFKDIELAKKMLGVDNKKDLQIIIYKHAAHKAWR